MKLFVETSGRGSDIVMLHGWGLHGGVFHRLAELLADRYRVHRVDLPGHGASAAVPYVDVEEIADWLNLYFPFPVHVLGWSLGGLVSQYWAQRHPKQVKSMVLVATSPSFVLRPDWPYAQAPQAIAALVEGLSCAVTLTLERFLVLQTLGDPKARATVKALRAHLFNPGHSQGLVPGLELLLRADSRPVVGEIVCPVTMFHGCRDVITPVMAARWLVSRLPSATLCEFAQASHAPFLSHETVFVEKLTAHLDQYV